MVSPPASPVHVYRALLADRTKTRLPAIEPTNTFIEYQGLLQNPAAAQAGWNWYLCNKGAPELELFL